MSTTAAPWMGLGITARRVLETIHRCPDCGQWICTEKRFVKNMTEREYE